MKRKFTFETHYEGKEAKAYVEIELKDNDCFSCSGGLIQDNEHVFCGQCLDSLTPILVGNHLFEVLYDLWKKYHLNDMHPGTPKQESALRKAHIANWASEYDTCCKYLDSVNLLVDDGYKFGSSWLKEEIPDNDLYLIKDLINKGTLTILK